MADLHRRGPDSLAPGAQTGREAAALSIENRRLREENHLLKYKTEVLLDMVINHRCFFF